jgi:CDP-diacylglycerol--glycerol-3-phosphate 3-phosphatidyltransferase
MSSAGGTIRMTTLYALKPAFQARLRPLVRVMARSGVTANQVTVAAALLSIVAGGLVAASPNRLWLLALPVALFLRMALNAVDGMLAREHGQASTLGMYLNELCDVVSDLAFILPFAVLGPFPVWGVVLFSILAVLTEFAGVLAIPAGRPRDYSGPMGKSDRAFALALLAVILATGFSLGPVSQYIFPVFAALSALTVLNRVRAGLGDAR